MASHKKTLLKTISWRIVGTVDTMLVTYLITGSMAVGLSIGGVGVVTKLILYYIHERMWERKSKS